MLHILGILFVVIIAILVIGLSIIGTVVRKVFGLGRRGSNSYQNGNSQAGGYSFNNRQQANNSQAAQENEHAKRKKLFTKEEGEYVEFEEVKD